ncbi:lipoyl domain-containing protein [Pedobacter caeni]|uniref:Biotin-requiring enzyme n=1 Tax=Pedobacter caeni TaxID=288992 RepID=A0A1M4VIH0_9SPHI|nr:lipoyl domain-containing protein [Pedobacter caeni]SHE68768.1 Biotin-requiring enzyme [Pedobacter caeni]
MQDYNKRHAEAINYFRNEARKAFAAICDRFGLQEENVTLQDTDNLFQVTFSNSKIRIRVEGINWGMNTGVCFGMNTRDSNLYGIHQLIKKRKPATPVTGNQTDQLFGYADYLMTYATNILQGDTSFFNQQDALIKKEKEKSLKAIQAESARKISEGYLKIDTQFGLTVWRKPRPLLPAYNHVKAKFPHSFEVVLNEGDFLGSGNDEAIISEWKIELEEIVKKDQVICEVSTDKVSLEIVAPEAGRLVWLLEEGIAIKFSACIALIEPQHK